MRAWLGCHLAALRAAGLLRLSSSTVSLAQLQVDFSDKQQVQDTANPQESCSSSHSDENAAPDAVASPQSTSINTLSIAAAEWNKVRLVGKVEDSPAVYDNSGTIVSTFRIALKGPGVLRSNAILYHPGPPFWMNVRSTGHVARQARDHLQKGTLVAVEGHLHQKEYWSKYLKENKKTMQLAAAALSLVKHPVQNKRTPQQTRLAPSKEIQVDPLITEETSQAQKPRESLLNRAEKSEPAEKPAPKTSIEKPRSSLLPKLQELTLGTSAPIKFFQN